jgi:excinuclease UvrABC nuclease subunit
MTLEDVKKLNIPTTPGSYQYYDKSGMILYIGKAANLRNRIFVGVPAPNIRRPSGLW